MRAAALGLMMLFAFARPAFADPTYLERTLTLPPAGPTVNVEVTLNEANASAAILLRATGWGAQNMRAIFTARDVVFTQESSGSVSVFRIDRVSLAITERNSFGDTVIFERSGTCAVATVPQRAF